MFQLCKQLSTMFVLLFISFNIMKNVFPYTQCLISLQNNLENANTILIHCSLLSHIGMTIVPNHILLNCFVKKQRHLSFLRPSCINARSLYLHLQHMLIAYLTGDCFPPHTYCALVDWQQTDPQWFPLHLGSLVLCKLQMPSISIIR